MRNLKILAVLLIGSLIYLPVSQSEPDGSAFQLTIHLQKDVYSPGEPFSGKVTLFSPYSATVPKTFFILLYRDGKLIAHRTTATPQVFFGHNTYTFEMFGIPLVTSLQNPVGHWTLIIRQPGKRGLGLSAKTDFDILGPKLPAQENTL